MRASLAAVFMSGLFLAGCGQEASSPALLSPVGPTAMTEADDSLAQRGEAAIEVPFRSEIAWFKIPGSDTTLCMHPLPEGKVYLMRNTIQGTGITTHLGLSEFEGHTCVYGTPGRPEGWFADFRWTAANGDQLVATSRFLYWTGTPGQSIAVDELTFQDGGTGRFQFAEGTGMVYVNAPEKTTLFEATLRYGKREK
jgi:hypothetical protein